MHQQPADGAGRASRCSSSPEQRRPGPPTPPARPPAMIASSRGERGSLRQLGDPAEQVQPHAEHRHAEQPGGHAVTEFVGEHADAEQHAEQRSRRRSATPVPVPGTTCETTGTPSATITATDSTQDGATTTGTPRDRGPTGMPRPARTARGQPRLPGARLGATRDVHPRRVVAGRRDRAVRGSPRRGCGVDRRAPTRCSTRARTRRARDERWRASVARRCRGGVLA